MFTFVLLGALWVVVCAPIALRHLHERRALPMEEFQRAIEALQTPGPLPGGPVGPTQASLDAAARRRMVSTLVYGSGLILASIGLVTGDTRTLTAAVLVGNLGTGHRLLAMRVDKVRRRTRRRAKAIPYVLPPAPLEPPFLEPPFEPGIDEVTGDGQTWGDGWQVIRPEPLGVDDLVLVDADVS
jgi:hypothetical protein